MQSRKTVCTACMLCAPVCRFRIALLREVPHASIVAAQDDNQTRLQIEQYSGTVDYPDSARCALCLN